MDAGHNSETAGARTQTWNLISPTIWNCGRFSGEVGGGGVSANSQNASAVYNANIHNYISMENTTGTSSDFRNRTATVTNAGPMDYTGIICHP